MQILEYLLKEIQFHNVRCGPCISFATKFDLVPEIDVHSIVYFRKIPPEQQRYFYDWSVFYDMVYFINMRVNIAQ